MPRIEVITSIQSQQQHHLIAAGIASVFTDEGMSAEHVSTAFIPILHTNMYAGRDSLDKVLGKRDFALLRAFVTNRRGQAFRDTFVFSVVRVFEDLGVDPSNVAIDFVPREALDAYIGTVLMGPTHVPRVPVEPQSVPLSVPDVADVRPPTASAGSTDVEGQVRDLLSRFWGGHVQSAASESTLLALVPNPVSWNSLAKAEIAINLETWLALPYNTLDVGTDRVKAMFGDTVTLGDLVDTLTTLDGRTA